MEFVVHTGSNLTRIGDLMNIRLKSLSSIFKYSPDTKEVVSAFKKMHFSSCAVVGSSTTIFTCPSAKTICDNHVVIHVNDHPSLLKICNRIDIQFLNAFACFRDHNNRISTIFTSKQSTQVLRPCRTTARIILRHEWNARELKRYASNAWLTTGLAGALARDAIGKGNPTSGGKAVAFAIAMCKNIRTYGIGRIGKPHTDSYGLMAPVHNAKDESKWLRQLHLNGTIRQMC